jgi:penicillin amidase
MIRRLFLGLLLLILVLGGAGYLYLRSSLPQIDGRVAVRGLHGSVAIARDTDGVPLITAGDDEDAAFGLGFAHAQDRLFQMEMTRRYGAGRLSEVLGQATIGVDKQMRVLGLYRAAQEEFSQLDAPVQRGLEAYAAGVNAFLATRGGPLAALPPEFVLLRYTPEPWKPADSLVWGKLMDLDLAGNYRGELTRARLARQIEPTELTFLYPDYPKDAPTTLAGLSAIYRQLPLDRMYAELPDAVGPIFASNNWVVDGAHSTSGKPVLANDPHLGFGTPGIWYLARLKTPQHEIAGATAAGVPLVVIGHNEKIAWGFTNTASDVEDLFIERLDPADPGRYLTPDGSAPFATREESIVVKGAAPISLTVRSTRHGPVLSDALAAGTAEQGYVLALATTFLSGDDRAPQALWKIDRAQDWNEFRAAVQDMTAPQQNMVFADIGGEVGFIAPARVPIRKKGDGWLPMPGWTGEYDWTGYIPFDQLPQATAPASGHLVSANNKIVSDKYPYFLSRDWDLPNRFERIDELLAAAPRQSPEQIAAIQFDTVSIAARQLVPLMVRAVPNSDTAREALDKLREWDFRMDADKVEPLLFTAWLRAFAHDVQFGHLSDAATAVWDLRPAVMLAVLTNHPEWCGKPGQPPATCDVLLAATLDKALVELSKAYGADMTQWQWGRAHVAQFPSTFWDRVPVVKDILHVSVPTAGGFDTVNRGSPDVRDETHPYFQKFGSGLRVVTDMAVPAESRMIVVPGQSGNPLSQHFSDLLQRWRDYQYLVPGQAPPVATLTLDPAPPETAK